MVKKPSGSSQQRVAKSPFEKLRTTGSSAYRLYALVAFYARAKKPLFDAEVTALFSQVLPEVCLSYEYELIAYRIMPNQVHLILGFKPTDAIADMVSDIKRSTAHRLFEGIPRLEAEIGKRNFWAEGYFAESLGHTQIEHTLRLWQHRTKNEEPVLVQIVYDLAQPLHPKQIERAMDDLLPAERVVMRLLHGLQGEQAHTLEQAAEKLSLKPEEVQQIAQESMAKIRALLRERRTERAPSGRSA
jgi:REP element-mobilizing transposase RayT